MPRPTAARTAALAAEPGRAERVAPLSCDVCGPLPDLDAVTVDLAGPTGDVHLCPACVERLVDAA